MSLILLLGGLATTPHPQAEHVDATLSLERHLHPGQQVHDHAPRPAKDHSVVVIADTQSIQILEFSDIHQFFLYMLRFPIYVIISDIYI